jgi:glycosyltransferase involved in cell wall biosynthesis
MIMPPLVEYPVPQAERGTSPEPVHPSVIMAMMGNREHYQPMRSAHDRGNLVRFITDFWSTPDGPLCRCARVLGAGDHKFFKARFAAELKHANVVALRGAGIRQYIGLRMGRGRGWRYRVYSSAGQHFARLCVRHLDVHHTAFVGFSSAALEALEYENRSGVLTVIDQIDPAKTEEAIVIEEMTRHKSWVLHRHDQIPTEYFERVSAEWSAAQRIIVNSAWSRSALLEQGVAADKLRVCPLAYQPPTGPRERRYHRQARLRVLWLGTLCLRKGIVYAIEAARRLERQPVDFTFAGPIDVRLPALPPNSRYAGSVPRSQIGALYSSHDIFILPTLSDGFGLTQLEAMAHGLPVIATPHCGEVVEHGLSGLIVSARQSKTLAEAILEIGGDARRLEAMSAAALARAESYRPERVWRTYASHLV